MIEHTEATLTEDERRTNSNKVWANTRSVLLAVILVGTLLRLVLLNRSLWLDEGIAIANAWAGGLPLNSWSDWFRNLWHTEFNMVFYFALLRWWIRIANSEAWLRLLSVIPAVATIPLAYVLGRKLLSRPAAMIAAVLLAVHGAHIAYSQQIRSYTLVVLLCTAATYFFIRGIEKRSRAAWVLYWLICSLAVYSHLFGALIVAAHWVSLYWAPRQRIPWRAFLVASIGIVVSSTAAIIFAVTSKGQQVEWIPGISVGQVVNAISEFAGSPTALPAYLFLWGAGLREFVRRSRADRHSDESWHLSVLTSWLLVPLLIAIVVSFKRPMLVPRYLLLSVPAATLMAAAGAMALVPRRRQIALWTAIFLSVAFVLFRFTRPKEDWRGASQYVLSHAEKSDVVIVVPSWSEPLFEYYSARWTGSKPHEMTASLIPEVSAAAQLAKTQPRVWLVRYQRDYALQMPETQTAEKSLSQAYRLSGKQQFRLVDVRLYTLPKSGAESPR